MVTPQWASRPGRCAGRRRDASEHGGGGVSCVVQPQRGDVGPLGQRAPRLGVDRGMQRMSVWPREHEVVLVPGGTGGKLLSGLIATVLA